MIPAPPSRTLAQTPCSRPRAARSMPPRIDAIADRTPDWGYAGNDLTAAARPGLFRPMRRAIVHIGTPRTGTTTLQHILTRLRPALAGAGVLYPDLTPASATAPHLSHQHLGEALDGRRPRRERAELLDGLAAQLRATPCDAVLLSYEGLCQAPPLLGVPRTLAALFAAAGFAMETVVTVKPQAAYLNSLYTWRTQFLREGRTFPAFAAAWMGSARLDLERMAAPWRAACGSRCAVVPVRDRRDGRPLVERVLAEAGLLDRAAPLLTGADAGLAENRSPGPVAVEVLRHLHAGGARRMLGARSREASRFVEAAARARGLDGTGFQGVSPALHARAAAHWAAANERLAMQAWGTPWADRVEDGTPPLNEVAALSSDPAVAVHLNDACAHFGIRLRTGWSARLHGLADTASGLSASVLHHSRTMLGGSLSLRERAGVREADRTRV